MQSKKLITRRRLLELRKLVIVTMVFLLSLSNFLPYSAQYAQANEPPSLSDLELTQDVDGEERKEVEKGTTFTFNVDALIPEDGSNEGTLTILNQVDKQLAIENVEVVVKEEEEAEEEESDLEAVVEGQDVSLELTPEQLDTVAGQHVTMKITAAFQDEVEAGTEIEHVAEAFINGELAEKAEPVTVALLADTEATSEETEEEDASEDASIEEKAQEETQQEDEASTEEENAGEESSEEEKASEEEQVSEEEQATEEDAEGEEAAEEATDAEANNNEIIEKLDIDACANPVALVNGEFDLPEGPGNFDLPIAGGGYYYADTVPGWETTDVTRTPRGIIQIMDPARPSTIPPDAGNKENLTSRFAELNADTHSMLYQELPTVPGQTIYWRVDHRSYTGVDTMSVNIGPVTDDPFNTTPEVQRISTGTVWETYSGSYTVPAGQTVTRFGFKAISTATGSLAFGNYIDNTFLGTEPCVGAEKSVSPEGEVSVGDELTYEVTVKNGGGDIAGNTIIEDAIPEGTEYVSGSMKIVNGPNASDLTDENDDDGGHFDGDKIVINLGDLPNTTELPDGITVQFKVKTLASHANEVVVNQANIGYKNLLLGEDETTDTNEVETPVVYQIPELESEKTATLIEKGEGNTDEDHVEVGDTLRYTIQARNIVSGSIVEGMVISDTIPKGLEYVADTLKVDGEAVTDDEDDDEGHYVDGGVVGNFGDVADADWHTLEFDVIVLPGQAGKDIENTALADGNNIDDPKEPSELVEVYPREGPVVEAEKTVSPEGEVFAGNILTYDVTIKNAGEHIAADTVFEDAIPEGTEYVPGSLKIVAGPNTGDLTDEEDDDAGHFAGDKVIIQLGNLETTTELPDGVTVQFQVMTLESHVGETVVNQADIQYRNLQTDEEQSAQSNEVTNEIVETPDIDACAQPVALVNGSFEQPIAKNPGDPGPPGYEQFYMYFHEDEVPGWKTTASDKLIQIMKSESPNQYQIKPPHGNQYAELNAHQVAALYQDVETTPGQTIYWRLAHRGLLGVDTMNVQIGSADIVPEELPVIEQIRTDDTEWVYYSGSYTVPAGQTVTRFAFNSVEAAGGSPAFGNILDDIFLGTEPCVVAEKSVSPEGEVFEGDQLTYEVTIKNNGGDVAADTIFEDAIPEGTEYVPGSMKILNGPKKGDLTDENDDDAGHFAGDKVIINIGELPNTTELEDGITVQFKVKTLSSHVGETVVNKATVDYKSVLTEKDKTTETNEVSNDIIEREDIDACARPVALINGSFEQGPERGGFNNSFMFYADEIPGWDTTDNSQGPYLIEIWDYALNYPTNVVRSFPAPPDGNRYAELNAYDNGLLYQDVETTPGQTIQWRLSHMGRQGVDTMQVRIGQSTDNPYDTEIIEQMSDGNTAWGTYTGTYTVPAGQTVTRFGFEAVSTAGGSLAAGNFLDDIFLGTEPCVEAEKTVSPEGEVSVGDELTYEVTIKNNGGDIAADAVFEDAIPEGTEYVPGSMKILTGANAGDLTDADDNDAGHFDGDKVNIQLGDLPNTTDLPDGITVQFKVKTLASHANDVVVNQANIGYKNLLTDEDKTTDTNEVETPVVYQKPVIESEKNATLLEKAEGNTDADNPEVGDTLLYTIQGRNTLEGSIAENFVIFDVIPEGLEYVPGTLKVNGEAVTDDEDDDEGHHVDGEVFGSFGDVTDTEWQTLEFQVIVGEGQAGKDIENVAVVDGDNLDEPDEPREEVKIYPREPKTESKKSAKNADESKERYEVGDTVVYTIESRNTVSDSLLENLKITDVLPEGLTFVEGSLEVSHGGTGSYEDGTVTAEFGEVKDTEWRTVTFEATIDSGYSGEKIKNVALVEIPNIDEPDEPGTDIDVDPKDPKPESEKSAALLEKAEGNTDADNPEVGDTLRYTIQTRNTIEDSLIENLVISDVIPEGLEYVPGTLKVNGEAVTDEEDDDQGHYVDGKVVGHFGDVEDTEWRTLEFDVVVLPGQAGKDIENTAEVDGDNLDDPDRPQEEVKIYPREPKTESKKSAKNADESKERYEVGDTVVYTIESRNTVSDSLLENLKISDVLPEGLTFVEGSLEVSHGGTGNYEDGTVTAEFGEVKDTEWRTVTFEATIDSGYSGETIENVALVEVPNIEDPPDEPGTDIDVDPKDPKPESEKSAALLEKAEGNTDEENPEVGDTLRYTIQTRNTIEDSLIANLTISDVIPEGLEYVPGTLKVNGEAVTDEEDDDQGHYVDGKAVGHFGDVKDTEWRTLEFDVVVLPGQAGKDIENTAEVDGDNLDDPDRPQEEVKIYPREPKTESKKSAKNADDSKKGYEVGDTVVYTIESRNTVEDSLLENLKITDVLPEGLTFVEGSLKVSDGGTGNYEDGTVTAEFGEVKDTEWRTVTFEATIDSGYVGETIKNVAVVEVPNIDEPDEPGTDIDVDPKEPKTESKKSATNADESKKGYEVGDTVVYTIESRNTVEDSLLENLKITDVLPEGLTFVEGSLEVSHGGTGSYEDGTVTAEFGEVKDTDWRTVTFEATIDSGYVGETIKNVAVVEVPNIDEPDEPGTDIDVDPKEPKTESKKSATNADESKDGYEVGDTVVYTIQSRNTVEDSLLENLKISDVLPEGLTFVEGSLEVSHGGTGSYEDGTVTAEFGEVKDTEWRTVTFEATIDSGYSGEKIKNVAVVEVPNIDEPDEPGTDIDVDPKDPKPESEKSAALLEKAEGNTDEENPEVGDTLRYTIQTRNTIEDSLIANLTISDVIPEGLEYVPGTLKVNGEAVTDEEDDDQGHYVDGKVVGHFGNVEDTEWRTLEFDVVVLPGQAGKDIENIAVVDGDNFDEPDEPREEVKIYPREPKTESKKSAKNADESKKGYEVGDTVVYTIESRNTVSDSLLENLKISDVLPEGLTFVEGSLKVSHGGTGSYEDGTVTAEFGEVKDTEWRTVTFEATINAGYAEETIKNVALVEIPNIDEPDEPGTEIVVDPKKPKTESEKSAELLEKADGNTDADNPEVGDTLVYTIQTRNTIEDSLLANLTIRDAIPAGLEYVPGTLKVNGEVVTDENDDDQGHVVDGEVFASFGNVTDTEWRTVEFQVIVSEGQAGKDIENVAVVDGDNFDEPDEPREEVKIYPREPKLESKKSAKNADESKKGYEVGDTVVYTIESRNTVSDSLLENLKITDVLPEGLTFVEGSLEVSDGGTGSFEDGTVTAEFGEVKDTEWRTVTFEATINAGYAEEMIKNVAVVEVPNIDEPDEPGTEIVVDPKQPKLESKKSAKNADDSKDGYEVGDTVVYTIETRNTIEDSLVEDLRITDQLPEGLTFVEGSLKVSEGGEGSYEDGTVTAEFGNVKDTEWRTVTFEATIEPGFINQTIKNVATVGGGNIDDPDKPEHEVDVEPKQPKLESKKSAKNADESKDGYEVGDTVVYTIEARNTVEDSAVEDLTIIDQLPEGLAFVEGSLKVSDGGTATFEDGTVTAEFGTVTDTEWRTVTFEATIESGTSIKNVATVNGGNIDDPDKPEAEIDINEPPAPPTPGDGDKEDPVDPTPGDKPEEPKPGNGGTNKPQEPTPGDKSPSDGSKLPKTATSTYNLLLIGASLLVLGAILWFLRRKKAA